MRPSFVLAGILAAAATVAAFATPTLARNETPKAQQAATDKQKAFIREAIQGNLAEIDMGKLAQQRSGNEAVKAFGRMLVEDHSAANEKARKVAEELRATLPSRPGVKARAVYAKLALLRGATFDRQFAKEMVSDHQKDIAAFRAQAQGGAEPTASMAKEVLPTLEKHLAEAQRLQTEVTAQKR
jgi:putative membrane protein